MKTTTISVSVLSLVFAFACGKGGSSEIDKLKDEVCACKDKACGVAANKKLDDALDKLQETSGKEPDIAMMGTIMDAGECLAKLK